MLKDTIFVSVASYRDKLCNDTINNLYKTAQYPDRVFVGICQQNKEGDRDCLAGFNGPPHLKKNVRIMRISYKDAQGPTLARYFCSKLYDKEDFFMQIDSHMLFVKDWDEKAIDMVKNVESAGLSKKVVLSHYPPELKDYKDNPGPKDLVTTIVNPFFNNDGIINFHGAVFKAGGALPRRNAFVAAGFIFARGALLREVPFDPMLPFLFTGEEILLSTRFYTHGWDVYTPNKNLLYHSYTREGEPKFWEDHRLGTDQCNLKVKMMIGVIKTDLEKFHDPTIRKSMEQYGLGRERSLEDFYRFAGIDPVQKKIGKPMIEFYTSGYSRKKLPVMFWVLLGSLLFLVILFTISIIRS